MRARGRHKRELLDVIGQMMKKDMRLLISESLPKIICHMYLRSSFKVQHDTILFLREIFGQNQVAKLLAYKFPDVMYAGDTRH
jgi:hypothetical protein